MLSAVFILAMALPSGHLILVPGEAPVAGTIVSMTADRIITLNNNQTLSAISWQHNGRPRPAWPSGPCLILSNGDRIAGEFVSGDDRGIRWKTTDDFTLTVPFAVINVLWRTAPPGDTPDDPQRYDWLKGERKTDTLRLANGDVLRGDLESFTSGSEVRIRVAGEATAKTVNIAAIGINPALTVSRKPTGAVSRITTRTGSRYTVRNVTIAGGVLKAATTFGVAIEMPLDAIVAWDDLSGAVVPLAGLTPIETVHEPYGTLTWPLQINRSVKYQALTLRSSAGVETFDDGLGTHPRTILTYNLQKKYRWLHALVGMDAVTGQRGTADIRMERDGKPVPLPALAPLRNGRMEVLKIDLQKADRLKLIIDFDASGDVQADVNWANARLCR